MATIEIHGAAELIDNLNRISQGLNGEAVVRAMHDATLYVTADAKRNAPVDTGLLRSSITPDVRSRSGAIEGIVGSNRVYAPFMELGTRPHWPPLAALETWARRHGTTAYLVARAISRRGLRPRRYLQRALDDNTSRIIRRFQEAVENLLK